MILLESATPLVSLFFIALAAFLSPLLASLTKGRVPDVVFLLIFGVVIGPSVLQLASVGPEVSMVRELGLGMLFLLAGYEMEMSQLRQRQGRFATLVWVVSLLVATGLVYTAVSGSSFKLAIAIGIALTSTALGTLLPIVKEAGFDDTPLGKAVFVNGAVGELGPVLAMSLLLTQNSPLAGVIVLLVFMVGVVLVAYLPARILHLNPAIGRVIMAGSTTTAQTSARAMYAVLTGLMALSAVLSLDVVLGAFATGMLLKRAVAGHEEIVDRALQLLGFSFLIPVFFVTSGMGIELDAVASQPILVLVFVVVILLGRGLPVFLFDRYLPTGSGLTTTKDAVRLGLYSATGLPIIVAVTQLAVSQDLMPAETSSLLVAAGGLTVLLFPLAAHLLAEKPDEEFAER